MKYIDKRFSKNTVTLLLAILQGIMLIGLHYFVKNSIANWDNMYLWLNLYAIVIVMPLILSIFMHSLAFKEICKGSIFILFFIVLSVLWTSYTLSHTQQLPILSYKMRNIQLAIFIASMIVFIKLLLPFVQNYFISSKLVCEYKTYKLYFTTNLLRIIGAIVFPLMFMVVTIVASLLFYIIGIQISSFLLNTYFLYLIVPILIHLSMAHSNFTKITHTRVINIDSILIALTIFTGAIILLFLISLIIAGIEPIWNTGIATPLMLSLMIVYLLLSNLSWALLEQKNHFFQTIHNITLVALPSLGILSIWSVYLRIEQYGLSIGRLWAVFFICIILFPAIGYAFLVLRKYGSKKVSHVNYALIIGIFISLLGINSPIFNMQRLVVNNQIERLIDGKINMLHFETDYIYDLGLFGQEKLLLLQDVKFSQSEILRRDFEHLINLGKLNKSNIDNVQNETNNIKDKKRKLKIPTQEEISTHLVSYQTDTKIPQSFIEYIHSDLKDSNSIFWFIFDYQEELIRMKSNKIIVLPLLMIDLNRDKKNEIIIMPSNVDDEIDPTQTEVGATAVTDGMARLFYSFDGTKWNETGTLEIESPMITSKEFQDALHHQRYKTIPKKWEDLMIDNIKCIVRPYN